MSDDQEISVGALITKQLGPVGPIEVAPHSTSGRNGIYTVSIAVRRQTLLLKYLNSLPGDLALRELDTIAYLAGVLDCLPELTFVSVDPPAHATVVSPHAVTLAELPPDDAILTFCRLSTALADLHSLAELPESVSHKTLGGPSELDPIRVEDLAQLSPAARELLRKLQQSPALTRLAAGPPSDRGAPMALIHGDIKPDNVLLDRRDLRLIDFELAGIGPTAWDLASTIGSMLHIWARTLARNDAGEVEETLTASGVSLPGVLNCVDSFLVAYDSASTLPLPSQAELSASLAQWLAGRAVADCAYAMRVPPSSWVLLQLANDVAAGAMTLDGTDGD